MCLQDGARLVAEADPGLARRRITSVVDHHMHIQSHAASDELRSVRDRMPDMFARLNPALLEPRDGGDALRLLDAAGFEQGVLLSEAYIFTSPFATPGLADPAGLTRAENRFNVDTALASNGRLKAFIGVNPFSATASDELTYWISQPGVSGVKLHLGNSGFDPSSDQNLVMLGDMVAQASAAGLSLIVHVRHPGPYQPSDTERFIRSVLSRIRGTVVQLAHGGGGGGVAEAVEVLSHYADALDRGAPGLERLLVDLSVVLVLDPTTPDNKALLDGLVTLARRIGIGRFVTGSDWPTLCSPAEHDALIVSQLPFTQEEWAVIAANRAAYLDAPA